jgi:excisionase family DNA binding protein
MHTTAEEVEAIMSLPTCSVEDVAKVLGIGRTQAYRAINTGEIGSIRIGGRVLVPTEPLRQQLGRIGAGQRPI